MLRMSEKVDQLYWEILGETLREVKDYCHTCPPLKWHPISKDDMKCLLKTWMQRDYGLWEAIGSRHSQLKFEAITIRRTLEEDQDDREQISDHKRTEKKWLDTLTEDLYRDALMRDVKSDTDYYQDMASRDWSLKELMTLVTMTATGVSAISLLLSLLFVCRALTATTEWELNENWLEFLLNSAVLVVLAQLYFDLHYSCGARIRVADIVCDLRLCELTQVADLSGLARQLFVYLPDRGLINVPMVSYLLSYAIRVSLQSAILFIARRVKVKTKRLDTKLKKLLDYTNKT